MPRCSPDLLHAHATTSRRCSRIGVLCLKRWRTHPWRLPVPGVVEGGDELLSQRLPARGRQAPPPMLRRWRRWRRRAGASRARTARTRGAAARPWRGLYAWDATCCEPARDVNRHRARSSFGSTRCLRGGRACLDHVEQALTRSHRHPDQRSAGSHVARTTPADGNSSGVCWSAAQCSAALEAMNGACAQHPEGARVHCAPPAQRDLMMLEGQGQVSGITVAYQDVEERAPG